jgi:hypothetical protein
MNPRRMVLRPTAWVFLIRRLASSGSVNDRQESPVRIIYGLDDRVTVVDRCMGL